MKLIKFIAAAALVASTSLVSGGNAAPVGATQGIAACTNWPYCRDVEVGDKAMETEQYIAACTNWPYCRDVEVGEPTLAVQKQAQVQTTSKAV